jgi:hypothetical protein
MTENTKIPAAQNSNDNRVKGIRPNEDAHVASGGIGGIHPSRVDPENRSEDGVNVQGVDTQTGTQAKGEYIKHPFNDPPAKPQNGHQIVLGAKPCRIR